MYHKRVASKLKKSKNKPRDKNIYRPGAKQLPTNIQVGMLTAN